MLFFQEKKHALTIGEKMHELATFWKNTAVY